MKLTIDNKDYQVIVNKKAIKNAYIRVDEKLEIVVSINRFVSSLEVKKLLEENKSSIKKMIIKQNNKNERDQHFYYLGEVYDIIINGQFFDIDHENKKIYTTDLLTIEKHIKKYIQKLFEERLKYNFEYMKLDIVYPKLKIRKMKSRWGVCNRRTHSITLNSELFKHTIKEIDYVIIHELVHFKHFDHGPNFWKKVYEYVPNYKILRKNLKQ